MTDEQIGAASKEISEFVKDLVKPWVDFRGHDNSFAKIIAKHVSAQPSVTLAMEEAGREWARTHDPSTFADIFEAMWKARLGAPALTVEGGKL